MYIYISDYNLISYHHYRPCHPPEPPQRRPSSGGPSLAELQQALVQFLRACYTPIRLEIQMGKPPGSLDGGFPMENPNLKWMIYIG